MLSQIALKLMYKFGIRRKTYLRAIKVFKSQNSGSNKFYRIFLFFKKKVCIKCIKNIASLLSGKKGNLKHCLKILLSLIIK